MEATPPSVPFISRSSVVAGGLRCAGQINGTVGCDGSYADAQGVELSP